MNSSKTFLALFASSCVLLAAGRALAQGCVAAHSNQRVISQLVTTDGGQSGSFFSPHNLTLTVGYRVFNSNKYFQGDTEIPRANAVRNHQNIFDIGVEYRLSRRWSFIADVPVFDGTRNQVYPPAGIYQVSGLGDMLVGAQTWIFRPPTESDGNIAVSAQLKIPTGINDATGSALYKGQTIKATADQSMQPGDGGWGFTLGTQGYKRLWHTAFSYGQATYLFNPRDTNGVPTFRSQPGQSIMSVTDQYLYRAGVSQYVPRVRGLALSLGIRGEGVPVRDLLGDSNGFRRPGFILSLDPGLMYITNGDAFFADYTVIASLTHHF